MHDLAMFLQRVFLQNYPKAERELRQHPLGPELEILADELESNTSVRANSLNPGATRTTMSKPFLDAGTEELDLFRRRIPLKRFAEPPEIASVIVNR